MPDKRPALPAAGEPEPLSVSIEIIDAAKAEEILQSNKYNRPVSQRKVTRYAMMMTQDAWVMTGESIIFNGEELLDGAHRLRAIKDSGKAQKLVVVRGVQAVAFRYIDSAPGRNLADSLYIEQRAYPRLFAAAVNYLAGFEKWVRWTTSGVEVPDRWGILEKYPAMEDILPAFASGPFPASLHAISRGVLVACCTLFHAKDPTAANEFMELLLSDYDDLPEANAVRAYHAWWMSVQRRKENRQPVRDLTAKTGNGLLYAWNLWRQDKVVDKLRPPTSSPDLI